MLINRVPDRIIKNIIIAKSIPIRFQRNYKPFVKRVPDCLTKLPSVTYMKQRMEVECYHFNDWCRNAWLYIQIDLTVCWYCGGFSYGKCRSIGCSYWRRKFLAIWMCVIFTKFLFCFVFGLFLFVFSQKCNDTISLGHFTCKLLIPSEL